MDEVHKFVLQRHTLIEEGVESPDFVRRHQVISFPSDVIVSRQCDGVLWGSWMWSNNINIVLGNDSLKDFIQQMYIHMFFF